MVNLRFDDLDYPAQGNDNWVFSYLEVGASWEHIKEEDNLFMQC